MQSSWSNHYKTISTTQLSASFTLGFALDKFNNENPREQKLAIDLGCGNGTDTLALLEQGWNVIAIDKQAEAINQLMTRVSNEYLSRLTTSQISFEEALIPPAHLINASFSLPFCPPAYFPVLWNKIINSLIPGGRFCGHFFGPEDSWSANADMTFHQQKDLIELFNRFSIEHWEETKRDGKTIGGTSKHWHVFHIVARYD